MIRAGVAGLPERVDLVVAGLGVTGAGVALDAATRGLSVVAVDAHDLAFGTSRFSSKLVHGGLRYLAKGQVGVAHESAVERGILMQLTAPHLVRPIPMLVPITEATGRFQAGVTRSGLVAGDLLRRAARTRSTTLPPPRRVHPAEALTLAPGLRQAGLRAALVGWDGQLEDDARLVIALARTADQQGATVRTRARVTRAADGQVELIDPRSGESRTIHARAVVNATGVWAADLDPTLQLRPSRGTHLVLRAGTLPGLRAVVTVPLPGSPNRFAMVLPQGDGRVLVGLTDVPQDGPVPDVAQPDESEIGDLLSVIGPAFDREVTRADVAGAFAGLRPLLDGADAATGTADLSRRHAVRTSTDGVVTVVGGKLTTYRRMAQDAVDAAVAAAELSAGTCRTKTLPLTGAGTPAELAAVPAPLALVRRYGTDATLVVASARAATGLPEEELLAPVAAGSSAGVTLAELTFGVTHEGAVDVADLLDRRTRIGLVPADRERALPAAERALELAAPKNFVIDR